MMNGEMKALLTIMRHREAVAEKLEELADELRRRARVHDRSKLENNEFPEYAELSQCPRHSPEFKELREKAEKYGCVRRHRDRESHHPEHHERHGMGWLDIIEMVIDWRAAAVTYNTPSLPLDIKHNAEEHRSFFNDAQWWLVEQVAGWLADD